MRKVRQVMQKLKHEDLVTIQKDLFNGGTKLRDIVSGCLREIEEAETRVCTNCGSKVNVDRAENFTLMFGPISMKKKASFCALDCLQYFFDNMKELSKTVQH